MYFDICPRCILWGGEEQFATQCTHYLIVIWISYILYPTAHFMFIILSALPSHTLYMHYHHSNMYNLPTLIVKHRISVHSAYSLNTFRLLPSLCNALHSILLSAYNICLLSAYITFLLSAICMQAYCIRLGQYVSTIWNWKIYSLW